MTEKFVWIVDWGVHRAFHRLQIWISKAENKNKKQETDS